jgi:hypothetical protein
MNMKSLMLSIVVALVLAYPCLSQAAEKAKKPTLVRLIPIPKREHGYSNFKSTVIKSRKALDSFQKAYKAKGMGWNNRDGYGKAIAAAKVDFAKETLVLIRHTEGSGSVRIRPQPPRVEKGKVIFQIDRKAPGMGTADMAYYCFAIAVSKAQVTEVEVRVTGRKAVVVKVGEAKKVDTPARAR